MFDIDILKTNIDALMKEHNTKQVELARHLGMSQPNISKALNLEDKKCFTVDQICRISDYYEVSIDYLVGKTKRYTTATKDEIAKMLVALIESDRISFEEIKLTEDVFLPEPPDEMKKWEKREMHYQALFFRDYFVPDKDDIEGMQYIEIDDHGNKTGNDLINFFLNNYIQIYLLYKKGALDEAAYRVVVQSLLNKVY